MIVWRVDVAYYTGRGLVREHNEDTIVVHDQAVGGDVLTGPGWASIPVHGGRSVVLAVADGLGGHQAGATASGIVGARFADAAATLTGEDELELAGRRANEALYVAMGDDPALTGMGTTLAGISVTNDRVTHFHAGDSRVYLEETGYLSQLTEDDAIPAADGSKTSMLQQCLGGNHEFLPVTVHTGQMEPRSGMGFLICSDGLSDMVGVDVMESCLDADLVASVGRLVAAAIAGGGVDNISVLLARLPG